MYKGVPHSRVRQKVFTFCAFVLLSVINNVYAQDNALTSRVLVVKNTNSPISAAVANDYMTRRKVTNVLNISCPDGAVSANAENIEYTDYLTAIEAPLLAYLAAHTQIDFIVLTKGVPIRITEAPDKPQGNCSLDSRVASLGYQESAGSSIVSIDDPGYGSYYHGTAWANKFFNSNTGFTHSAFGGYLVTRLDGYTQADAIALTTRSLLAEQQMSDGKNNPGPILLDECPFYGFTDPSVQPYSLLPSNYTPGQTIYIVNDGYLGDYNADMDVAANYLTSTGIPVLYDTTATFIGNKTNLAGYDSWASNDTDYTVAAYHSLSFAAGAVCETVCSTNARTFLPTTGGQSLITDLISQGVTGVKGYTDEPMQEEIASPSILFNRYVNGWTLAESFYAASREIGWMGIIVGDPICRAYTLPQTSSSSRTAVVFYPNPSADMVKISDAGYNSYKIYDMTGKLIKADSFANQQIDLSDLSSGMYIVAVSNGTNVVSKKIIKLD
jgi:hypothetical protein